MISVVIVITSILVLALSLLLFKRAAGEVSIGKLNMLSYSFYVLLVHAWFGAVIVTVNRPFLVYDPADFRSVVDAAAVRYEMWGWLMWLFIGLPLGAIIMGWILRTGPMTPLFGRYRRMPAGFEIGERSLFVAFCVVGGAFLAITANRLAAKQALPILNAFQTQDVEQTLILRRDFRLSSGLVSEVIDTIFSPNLIAWMSYASYAAATVTKLKRWWIMFAVAFGSSLLLFVVNTTIAPTFTYLAGFLLVRVMLGLKVIRLSEIAAAVSLLAIMEFFFKNAEGSIMLVLQKTIIGRIMTGQLMGFYYAKHVFPNVEDFIGFESTGNVIHAVLGLPTSPSYGIVMMRQYNALAVEAGTGGHMTTIFMGEAWANFGYLGLIVAPLWVGGFVQAINSWFLVRRKGVMCIALYAFLATTFGYHTDFIGFYYPLGTFLMLLGVGVVLLFARIIQGK